MLLPCCCLAIKHWTTVLGCVLLVKRAQQRRVTPTTHTPLHPTPHHPGLRLKDICWFFTVHYLGEWCKEIAYLEITLNAWCTCIMHVEMGPKISTGHTHWGWLRRAHSGTSAAYRFPSTTSMRSSAVESLRRVMSALWILYSARILLTVSASSSLCAH